VTVPFNERYIESDLVCAFFDESQVEWTALNCPGEGAPTSEGQVTCCTDHLTKFALIPRPFLSMASSGDIKATPARINLGYLAGSIVAFVVFLVSAIVLLK